MDPMGKGITSKEESPWKGKKKQREDTREMTPLKEWHRVDAIKK